MVFTSAIRSRSLRFDVAVMYSSTTCFCSFVVISATKGCSGANVIKLTPKIVSGRVVNTSIVVGFSGFEMGNTLKETDAPTDFPIQLRWVSLILSDQSKASKP